jgi:hypothetical protein
LNGSRDQSKLGPDRARLCKSNAQLIEAIANDKLEEIRGRVAAGRTPAASVGPNDGGRAGFCTCDECKKLDPPEGRKITLWDFSGGARKDYEYVSLTDRVVFFWNGIAERVAREFPDALLTADGYSAYQAPPVKREFHPNLVVRFAGIGYGSDAGRRTGLDDWNGWAAKAKKMYWRPNLLLAGRRDGLPFIYIHKLAQDFRYLADHGMIGTDFDSCVHNWATQGLNYYVCAKLHWRPDLDVDALIDDYCRAGFGAAAAEVKAYFARLEALLDQAAAKEASFVDHLMPDVLGELRRLLDDARAKAAGDEDARRRVDFLRVGFDFTEVQAEVYAMLAKARAGEKPEKARVDALMDRKYAMMRDIFDRNNLAVNVAYCCWGEWGYFGQLGWTGPTQKAVKPVIDADEAGKPVKEAR